MCVRRRIFGSFDFSDFITFSNLYFVKLLNKHETDTPAERMGEEDGAMNECHKRSFYFYCCSEF